jgi:nitrogen fixation-related uncharacterized protein
MAKDKDSDSEIMGPYAVAVLMGIGAVFIFIWGVLSGAFRGADVAAFKFTDSDFEIMGQYVVALLLSIGAVFIFIWGVLSGALSGDDEVAIRFYRAEMENDGTGENPERASG